MPAYVPPPDTVLQRVEGARGLTTTTGFVAWAEPAGQRWRLVVRRTDGTLLRPPVPTFAVPPEAELGTGAGRSGGPILTYARCAGRSAVRGCDVWAVDPRGGGERRVPGLSDPAVSETTPDVSAGRWVYGLRGGARPGLLTRSADGRVRRLSARIPEDASIFETKVAFLDGRDVCFVGIPRGRVRVLRRAPGAAPQTVGMSNYRLSWREGERLLTSTRLGDEPARALPGRVVLGLRAVAVGSRASPLLLTGTTVLGAGSSGAFGRSREVSQVHT